MRCLSLHKKILIYTWISTILFLISTGCEKSLGLKKPDTSAASVFDEAWNVMDKRYAMFDIKAVDWKATYDTYHPEISEGTTETQLFSVMKNMFETLRDGHVTLISSFDTSTYENFYKPYPTNFNYDNIKRNYLQDDYETIGPVILKIVDNVAYIYYGSFENDIHDADVEKIFSEIAQTKGLIVDVRNNFGGHSDNVTKIFSHFISEKTLVKYEMKKNGPAHEDFSAPQPFYISPAAPNYNYPIVLLTNRACFSACNDFALYMSNLPNVIIMGDQTGGGGGIPQDYILANGWTIQFTATITLSPDKQNIENGIVPDINVSISPADESIGKDPIIEKAFQMLK